eukprot:scaffold10644_cov107-Isochrysis_galbana.AAC.4
MATESMVSPHSHMRPRMSMSERGADLGDDDKDNHEDRHQRQHQVEQRLALDDLELLVEEEPKRVRERARHAHGRNRLAECLHRCDLLGCTVRRAELGAQACGAHPFRHGGRVADRRRVEPHHLGGRELAEWRVSHKLVEPGIEGARRHECGGEGRAVGQRGAGGVHHELVVGAGAVQLPA